SVDGTLFFRTEPQLNGGQLWGTDGSETGTGLLKSFSGFFQVGDLAGVGGGVVFASDDGVSGDEMWGSGGTTGGPGLARGIVPRGGASFPAEFTAMDGMLFFSAAGSLWKTDGSAAGTVEVAHVGNFDDDCRSPFALTVVRNALYFRTCIANSGTNLWKS